MLNRYIFFVVLTSKISFLLLIIWSTSQSLRENLLIQDKSLVVHKILMWIMILMFRRLYFVCNAYWRFLVRLFLYCKQFNICLWCNAMLNRYIFFVVLTSKISFLLLVFCLLQPFSNAWNMVEQRNYHPLYKDWINKTHLTEDRKNTKNYIRLKKIQLHRGWISNSLKQNKTKDKVSPITSPLTG